MTLQDRRRTTSGLEIVPSAPADVRTQDGATAVVRRLFLTDDAPQAGTRAVYRPLVRRLRYGVLSFLLFVVIPSAASIAYLAFFASPQYAATAKLIIRTAEFIETEKVSSLPGGVALSGNASLQYAYIVAQYARSRTITDDLRKELDFTQLFRRPGTDWWAGLQREATVEELVRYWRSMVYAYVDAPSGIISIEVRAFQESDALQLAQAIVRLSEQLINTMSERAREDIMRTAQEEVRRADGQLRKVQSDLRTARDATGILDPTKSADERSKLLLELITDKIKTESDLFLARRSLDKTSPVVRQLESRLEIANVQVEQLKTQIAGDATSRTNMAAALSRFEELEVERQYSEKILSFAEEGLERARKRAEQQNVYLLAFQPPALPQDSQYPQRLAYSLLIPFALLLTWGSVALIGATIRDHSD